MLKVQEVFQTQSVVKTTALCVVTFGLYVIYQLFVLTVKANPHVSNPISKLFTHTAVAIHLASFSSLLVYFAIGGPQELLIASKVMHIISSVFHLVWLLKLKNRINIISGAAKGSNYWLNPFLSSFFHVIYIQHKINQSIAKAKQPAIKNAI